MCIRTENAHEMSFCPFTRHEISVLIELIFGHPRYCIEDVPPQPNSPSDYVFDNNHRITRNCLVIEIVDLAVSHSIIANQMKYNQAL